MYISVRDIVGCMFLLLDFGTFPTVWYFLFHQILCSIINGE